MENDNSSLWLIIFPSPMPKMTDRRKNGMIFKNKRKWSVRILSMSTISTEVLVIEFKKQQVITFELIIYQHWMIVINGWAKQKIWYDSIMIVLINLVLSDRFRYALIHSKSTLKKHWSLYILFNKGSIYLLINKKKSHLFSLFWQL